MRKSGLFFALLSVVAVSACDLSQPPGCLIGSIKCEQNKLLGTGIIYVCDESNQWHPTQSCASCESGICSNPSPTIECENEGETSCSTFHSVSIQFECHNHYFIPKLCGKNNTCDGDRCSKIHSGCETEGEKYCFWIDELQAAIQTVCSDHKWMAMYCGHGLVCNGEVCDEQVSCTKPGEILDKSTNQCICDSGNHWTGTDGNCSCEDGYLKIHNEMNNTDSCEEENTCTKPGEILDKSTNQCICDSDNHWTGTDGNCSCEAGSFLNSDGDSCITCSELVAGAKKGDSIYFGHYQQLRNNTTKYPIEWEVLKVNSDDITVISKYILDNVKYNKSIADVTWETSTLRSWLNGFGKDANLDGIDYSNNNFIKKAFNDEELKCIQNVTNKNPDNQCVGTDGGNDTEDKVFVLSLCEAGYKLSYDGASCTLSTQCPAEDPVFFTSQNNRIAYATDYTMNKVAPTGTEYVEDVSKYYTSIHYSYDWWLRSPGKTADEAAFVYSTGSVRYYGRKVQDVYPGVRPALHLKK